MPRITIGDGSLYIETPQLTSWEFSPQEILSLVTRRQLDHVRLTVNGDAMAGIPVHESVAVAFGANSSLTVAIGPLGKVSVILEGGTFEDDRWRAVGNNVLRYDAPGVHIERVTIDGTVYYESADEFGPERFRFPEKFRRRSGCQMSAYFKAALAHKPEAMSSGA